MNYGEEIRNVAKCKDYYGELFFIIDRILPNLSYRCCVTLTMKKSYLIFSVLILLLATGPLHAQWKLVASNVIISTFRPYNGGGVITNQNGILWAGYKDIWMSSDTGKTWALSLFLNGANDLVKDISFYDDNIGLATMQNGEIFITGDQGLTWTQHIPNNPYHFKASIESARFLGSPNNIVACTYTGDRCVSTDGGLTWIVTLADSIASQVIAGKGGTGYIAGGFDLGTSVGVRLHETHDFGLTWFDRPALIDWDSYSFSRDECDTSVFYAVSDDQEARTDKFSHVFTTNTSGDSWLLTDQELLPSFCGSVTTSSNAIYIQTYSGIRRSTDQGRTWKDIGGPPNVVDTRFVTAVNNNVVVAVDSFGSVWVTTNSGGDSLAILDGSKISIQTADQKTDTLGGTVAVPINVNGLNTSEDFDIILHYDPQLIYRGTFSAANTKLDIAGQSWSGRSRIHVQGVNSTNSIANSYFDVFSDSSKKFMVTFDSLIMLSAIVPCNNIVVFSAASVITPPSGCSADMLTHFLRDSAMPQFALYPNPTGGEISLRSSRDLGNVDVTIYDMIGEKRSERMIVLEKNIPAAIDLPSANGVYTVRITSSYGVRNLRAVTSH
ncbi:MAG: T9SS type A sorting domain-containing protein [Candidatus Kapaibacterium sp.]